MKPHFSDHLNSEWLSTAILRLKLTPLSVWIYWCIFSLIRDCVLAYLFGVLTPTENSTGLLGVPAPLLQDCLVHPTILAYFCWIQTNGFKPLQTLLANRVLDENDDLRQRTDKWMGTFRNSRVAPSVFLIGVVVLIIWLLALHLTPPQVARTYWVLASPWIVIFMAPALFIVAYALVLLIYDALIMVTSLNNILESQKIRVDVLNPDSAGGLGSIGNLVANVGYFIAALGISYSIPLVFEPGPLWNDVPMLLGIIVYVVLAPVVFFAPLWVAHWKMVEYRDDSLRSLADEFEKAMIELRNWQTHSQEEIEVLLKSVKQIHEMHDLIMRFPTWPFNASNFRKFFWLAYSTISPALLSIGIDALRSFAK